MIKSWVHNLHTAVSMSQTVAYYYYACLQHKNFMSVSGVGRHYESAQ